MKTNREELKKRTNEKMQELNPVKKNSINAAVIKAVREGAGGKFFV